MPLMVNRRVEADAIDSRRRRLSTIDTMADNTGLLLRFPCEVQR